jgi:hypothetical protein
MSYQNLNLGFTVTPGELKEPSARSFTARAVVQAKKMQIKVEALMITDEVQWLKLFLKTHHPEWSVMYNSEFKSYQPIGVKKI